MDNQMVISDQAYVEIMGFKPIFYDIYSPIEARRLFQMSNVIFDRSVLNPVYNMPKYNSSSKIAVNLGIYGADMSYCHMFGQTQDAINYLSTISRLAQSMGISDRFISNAEKAHENLVYHPDTLFNLATEIYISADQQLLELGRAEAASLILAGGWVEALYIAGSFYNPDEPNQTLEEQILSQKYSLDRLVALLSNQQNDDIVSKYLLLIKQLRHLYENVEISFELDDLTIDNENRTIVAQKPRFSYTENTVSEIIQMINLIRQDMVN